MKEGDKVYWYYNRGGYIPATIKQIKGKKAIIAIKMRDGSTMKKTVTLALLLPSDATMPNK